MRSLGIVRRLVGCFYCGQPCGYRENRGDVCWQCADLPLKDPLVAKARQPLSEQERIEARRMREFTLNQPRGEWVVEIRAEGRRLLGIRYDGTWVIEPEDAPEAARLFAELVAGHVRQPLSEAERIEAQG